MSLLSSVAMARPYLRPMELAELYYCGEKLKDAIFAANPERHFLIDRLIPEHSITMFYGPDGCGKSTLLTQLAIQAASGLPVFGEFDVIRPLTVIYIMAERHISDTFEKIKRMSLCQEFKWENFAITSALQGINLLQPKENELFVQSVLKISRQFKKTDIVCLDPLYAMVPKGLKDEDGAGVITGITRRLINELDCAPIINHHPNRGVKKEDGSRTEGDDFGSRFLSANCTAKYRIRQKGNGTEFENEKDSFTCCVKKFSLEFDLGSYLSNVDAASSKKSKRDMMLAYVVSIADREAFFTYQQLAKQFDSSPEYIRKTLSEVGETRGTGFGVKVRGDEYVIINVNPSGTMGKFKVTRRLAG